MSPILINITIPVLNEEKALSAQVNCLAEFLSKNLPYSWEIVIADNGSEDKTLDIAMTLAREVRNVRVLRLETRGRGGAIKASWDQSKADVLSYMDVDLSTSLDSFPKLVNAIVNQRFDIAVGSRLLNPSLTKRGLKREFISRCYNLLIKLMFSIQFSDAQCGFKAISRVAAQQLLPLVADSKWFFDTELLICAERHGYRICDLAVPWIDDPDSRVDILQAALDDLKGLARLRFSRHSRR
jgi:glycosyltransferase involved in cell wall biosynthesis